MRRVPADPLLDRLDPAQRRAVSMENPLVAVIAGAGSGKTTVLARRIAYRIANGAADPRHVLALTFTRQAAQELRGRLRDLGLRDDVQAGTFHAVALGLMRQRWVDTGRPAPQVVSDRRRLVADVLGRRAGTEVADIAAEIDWARARLITPDGYEAQARLHRRRGRVPTDQVAATYADLEVWKRRRGVVDLDDLLGEVLGAVQRDPQFGAALRWRFRHLFVDEAQDLNPLQAAVLAVLRGTNDDLTLVGDPNQAIFGFNGADPDLLREVERRFPGVEVVRLDTNYRCTPEIVAAGASVLPGDGDGLRSGRPEGATVTVQRWPDADREAEAVAEQVRRWGDRWRGIAVLARTNAQLPPIARALEARGIPVGGARTDLRSALADATAQRDASRLRAWSRDVLHPADEDAVPHLRDEARATVAHAVAEFLDDDPTGDGRAFGDWVRANRPFDVQPSNAVELLTFHAAKGREWSRVVVAGVESGLVPHRSAATSAARDEEARLLYVAMTRGADEVVLTSAATRGGKATRPSPFLDHLPATPGAAPPPPRAVRRSAPAADPVRQRLDEWRTATARAAGVSPAVVCPDPVLAAIASAKPASTEALADIPGVGVLMARRFGPRILAAVSGKA